MEKTFDAKQFIDNYFYELFEKHNIDSLDYFLHEEYYDDDIGQVEKDHKKNSKEYLKKLFIEKPGIKVKVGKVITEDDVITAYLEWIIKEKGKELVFRKGIGIFEMKDGKIKKRYTHIYFKCGE